MPVLVQRVTTASVEVDGRVVSEIGPGLLVLVGVHKYDSDCDADSDADYICRKVLNMTLFPNERTGKAWDQNVMQKNYGVLLVSHFTLYGVLKGNKPDFHMAMRQQRAKPFYEILVEKFRKAYNPDAIKGGVFGAMMKVNLVNDGPVTMQLDSSSQPSKNTNAAGEGSWSSTDSLSTQADTRIMEASFKEAFDRQLRGTYVRELGEYGTRQLKARRLQYESCSSHASQTSPASQEEVFALQKKLEAQENKYVQLQASLERHMQERLAYQHKQEQYMQERFANQHKQEQSLEKLIALQRKCEAKLARITRQLGGEIPPPSPPPQ